MHSDDQILVATFRRKRDETSFRQLYRQHTPRLFAMAVRLCGTRNDAEELTQEAWMRAVEKLDGFQGDARFNTWISAILINCFREMQRSRARNPLPLEDIENQSADVIPVFQSDTQTKIDATDLDRALSTLASGYREIITLHDVYGYTHQEIATLLGIQEGTSKSQLMRGRAQLRNLLKVAKTIVPDRNDRGIS